MNDNDLLDILVSDGTITSEQFSELANKILIEQHGYTQSDCENMSYDDVRERIEDIFNMDLEEAEDGTIHLVGYRNIASVVAY